MEHTLQLMRLEEPIGLSRIHMLVWQVQGVLDKLLIGEREHDCFRHRSMISQLD